MREELLLELVVLLILGYSTWMGFKRGLLVTLLYIIRRILVLVVGFVLWRVIMTWMPDNAPGLASGIVFSVALVLAGALFHFLVSFLRIVDRVPVLKQINKVLGLVVGFLGGLVNVWILFLVLRVFGSTEMGGTLMGYVVSSNFLYPLYQLNPLLPFVNSIMGMVEGL